MSRSLRRSSRTASCLYTIGEWSGPVYVVTDRPTHRVAMWAAGTYGVTLIRGPHSAVFPPTASTRYRPWKAGMFSWRQGQFDADGLSAAETIPFDSPLSILTRTHSVVVLIQTIATQLREGMFGLLAHENHAGNLAKEEKACRPVIICSPGCCAWVVR